MSNLTVIEHQNQRVLTTQQLADGYEAEIKNIQNNFIRNMLRYELGVHYYLLDGEEFRQFKADHQIDDHLKFASSMYLWTEKGALLHAKSLNTDKAWDVYQELVDTYFRSKQLQSKPLSTLDALAQTVQVLQEQSTRILQLESTTQAIKDTIITQPDNWRDDLNRMFNKIAISIGENKFRDLRTESYKLLEQRAHADLSRRLIFYKARLEQQGVSKSKVNQANKLDVIEQDPKLREIYSQIVKEYFIAHCA